MSKNKGKGKGSKGKKNSPVVNKEDNIEDVKTDTLEANEKDSTEGAPGDKGSGAVTEEAGDTENGTEEATKVDEEVRNTVGTVSYPSESPYVIESGDDELDALVNRNLETYAAHMGSLLNPSSDVATVGIRLLQDSIIAILRTSEDDVFEKAWGGLCGLVSGAEEGEPLHRNMLTRGAHDTAGVPTINDNTFNLLILMGMDEGSTVDMTNVTKGLPPVAIERLMAYYS